MNILESCNFINSYIEEKTHYINGRSVKGTAARIADGKAKEALSELSALEAKKRIYENHIKNLKPEYKEQGGEGNFSRIKYDVNEKKRTELKDKLKKIEDDIASCKLRKSHHNINSQALSGNEIMYLHKEKPKRDEYDKEALKDISKHPLKFVPGVRKNIKKQWQELFDITNHANTRDIKDIKSRLKEYKKEYIQESEEYISTKLAIYEYWDAGFITDEEKGMLFEILG